MVHGENIIKELVVEIEGISWIRQSLVPLKVWGRLSLPGRPYCGRILLIEGSEEKTGLVVVITTWKRNSRAWWTTARGWSHSLFYRKFMCYLMKYRDEFRKPGWQLPNCATCGTGEISVWRPKDEYIMQQFFSLLRPIILLLSQLLWFSLKISSLRANGVCQIKPTCTCTKFYVALWLNEQ